MKASKLFECSPDCDSRDPGLGAEKPCNCWNAYIAALEEEIEDLESEIDQLSQS